jgi:N-acetylmuramoyl-L-alanine amidase
MSALLRRGDVGPRVSALRAQLAVAGHCPATAEWGAPRDGGRPGTDSEVFDAELERAIRAFQQRRGLVADGIVGPQTSRLLDAARWRLGDRILLFTPGHLMRGDDVAALQERLVVLGVFAGPVDGIFGPDTESALRELQRGLGLPPDGLCGPTTLRALAALARAVGGGDPWALRQQADVAVAGSSLAGRVVVIDPGHGGVDPGVVGHGLAEADVVLDIAARVEGRLAATGVAAVLTRGVGNGPDDVSRATLAQDVGADVVLSLHCDGHGSPRASGIATFFWGDDRVGARSAVGERLAQLVQSEVTARTGLVDLRSHACTTDLVRITRMPAIQVEVGYLTNPDDAARLGDPAFRDAVAESLLIAVQRLYLGDEDAATGTLQLHDVLSFAGRA